MTNIFINILYNKQKISYNTNIGSKKKNCMDEYYVSHFYQMKRTIKYYFKKTLYIICTQNFILWIYPKSMASNDVYLCALIFSNT